MTTTTTEQDETSDSQELDGTPLDDWWVEGSYFEACNCDPVCPCRRLGDREGGRSTYGICDFAASWRIERGEANGLDLSGPTLDRYMDKQWRFGRLVLTLTIAFIVGISIPFAFRLQEDSLAMFGMLFLWSTLSLPLGSIGLFSCYASIC